MAQLRGPNSGEFAQQAGWAELADSRWADARESFERAIAADETAAAYEGLSWAAWWLDDEATVFQSRAHAHRLYKRNGNPAGAARMATWLACDELDFRGAFPAASGWLAIARRLLEDLPPGPEHGWLFFFEGYLASASGDSGRAAELAVEAAALGRRLGVPDLQVLGLALEGAALVATAEVSEGMRRLDEATTTALSEQGEVPIAGAWAFCFTVTACLAVRDYDRASEWCDRIAEFAARYGSRYMLAFCRAEYGVVHLWRGDWRQAEVVLEASLDDFAASRPAGTGGALRALAELRRRQGRPEDAAALLEQAGPSPASQLIQGRMALDRGDARSTSELVERALRQLPADHRFDRAAGLELLVCALAARGELDAAGTALASLREVADLVGTGALQGSLRLAAGVLTAAGGEHERARILLEDAVDSFARTGGRYDAARARLELAATLLTLGRAEAARAEAEAAHAALHELGAVPLIERARGLLEASSLAGPPPLSAVTPREREVLTLVAVGLTNREIAERLVVSEHTVHRHVTNILRKLDLPSRAAAAVHAARSGLIEPPIE